MGKETEIAWTDHTWNPWQGCRPVSPGCTNCYMYREKRRFKQDPATVIRSSRATFNAPLRWKDPAKVFVCSWSDFFIDEADQWRPAAWEIMRKTQHLTYQVLTKRPENIAGRLPDGWPFLNVWLGVTAENQDMADARIPVLMEHDAAKHFVSIEPMIGPVDLGRNYRRFQNGKPVYPCTESYLFDLDWVIVGGETGPTARVMNHEWAESLLNLCRETGTPFFMKQMTAKAPIPERLMVREFPFLETK